MIVLMTSGTWNRVQKHCRDPCPRSSGQRTRRAAPLAAARSAGSVEASVRPPSAPAAAPTMNCPSAPMLKTPARNASATARPVRMSGGRANQRSGAEGVPTEPNAPSPQRAQRGDQHDHLTPRRGRTCNPGAGESSRMPNDWPKRENGKQPLPSNQGDDRIRRAAYRPT